MPKKPAKMRPDVAETVSALATAHRVLVEVKEDVKATNPQLAERADDAIGEIEAVLHALRDDRLLQ
jgi:hypothetical protein